MSSWASKKLELLNPKVERIIRITLPTRPELREYVAAVESFLEERGIDARDFYRRDLEKLMKRNP